VAAEVEAADGRRGRGYASDNLAPKWFDKDPTRSFHDDVEDELAAIRIAHDAYLEAAVGSLSAPGYGGVFEPDLSSMTPLERWSFDSLEPKF
jgi:hypothetical protein